MVPFVPAVRENTHLPGRGQAGRTGTVYAGKTCFFVMKKNMSGSKKKMDKYGGTGVISSLIA